MVIPAEYGVLTVGLWLAVAVGTGLYALLSTVRRHVLPMTPSVIAFSMTAGGFWLFPDAYMNHPIITALSSLIVFVIIDLFVLGLILRLRFRTRPPTT